MSRRAASFADTGPWSFVVPDVASSISSYNILRTQKTVVNEAGAGGRVARTSAATSGSASPHIAALMRATRAAHQSRDRSACADHSPGKIRLFPSLRVAWDVVRVNYLKLSFPDAQLRVWGRASSREPGIQSRLLDFGSAHPSRLLPTWTMILLNSGKPEFGGASPDAPIGASGNDGSRTRLREM
jgi:hypothetical protein